MASVQRLKMEDVHPDDVEVYEQLAKLQQMHGQVNNLRSLLPGRLLGSTLLADRQSPEKFAATLRDAATSGSTQITSFKRAYHSEEMHQLWRTVNNTEFPQGEDVWPIDYAGSLPDLKRAQITSGNQKSDQTSTGTETEGDIEAIISAAKARSPGVEITTSANTLPLIVTVSAMKFTIMATDSSDAKPRLVVSSVDDHTPSAYQNSILQFIQQQHQQASLSDLLALFASYHKLESQPCRKCGKVLDGSLQLPLFREKAEPSDDSSEVSWQAVHASCR
ncbi:uncharacterized protein AB675_10633 [Cyphellophora attinorum]|uniref:Mediator of RNA polymerase II transcription subunit 27 n=1 Tax=Cyphellophora attinorum TaxID=1664694 RepID=A0A0N0NN53_9EURO|nr:uncharacterized protein AB675_10633 [Phialophora attinorum]KPI40979.1 hypothetical protein AB675_10633 [Phialophora attinorum]